MHHIIIIGPQGSGKGTQADLLSQKLGIPRIETGSLWRKEIAENTAWGRDFLEACKQGKLAPDDQTVELLRRRISAPDAADGFILDGFPRNIKQVELLDGLAQPSKVILLTLPDDEAIKRLVGRLLCKKCGVNYHVVFNPPKNMQGEKWLCDNDHEILVSRDDDKPNAIKERLHIYHTQTEPIVDIYRARNIVCETNAGQDIEKVHADIMQALGK